MSEAKTGPKMELTPMQLAAVLVIEGQIAQLQVGANQLGGFLGLKREADILINAIQVITKDRDALVASWAKQVKIYGADAAPKPVIQGVR